MGFDEAGEDVSSPVAGREGRRSEEDTQTFLTALGPMGPWTSQDQHPCPRNASQDMTPALPRLDPGGQT